MIVLHTGVPGAGKTLAMVHNLYKLQQRWLEYPDEVRPVFVLGIPDLALPHNVLPLKSVQIQKNAAPVLVPDWAQLPDGALVLADEAQGIFPPRSSASITPEHVAFLNVHRHKGLDIWVSTQHPKLIDGSVRALVGKHLHFRRMFGGSRAVVYEWDSCSDGLSGMTNAVKTYFRYPKGAYKYYKSAELHTKQTFKKPIWLLLPFVGIAMGIYFFPHAYAVLSSGMGGKGLANEKPDSSISSSAVPSAIYDSGSLSNNVSHVTAPNPDEMISACLATATRCQCYTHSGVPVALDFSECKSSALRPSFKFRLNVPDQPQVSSSFVPNA